MNPQAFPNVSLYQEENGTFTSQIDAPGMTLRDYFAAKALPEILAQKDVHRASELENAAWISYQMADAMLKARAA